MHNAKVFRFQYAVAAVCVMAALLTGCRKTPDEKKQMYMESGQHYFDEGKYPEAAIKFQNAIQIDARFAEGHYKLALTALKMQQWEFAYLELSKTIDIQPDRDDARLELAKLLVMGRHFPEAKQNLDLLAPKQTTNPDFYVALANYEAGINNTSAALADMQKALQLDPNRSDSHLNLAMLQARGQQWDAAEASFKKAIALSPKSTSALLSLGGFYASRGRYPESEQMFRQAIAAAPDDPTPSLSLAALYVNENKAGQAEEFLRQAKKAFPNNSVGYRMLGDFYFANNQLDKATDEYAALYRDHPKDLLVKKNYVQLLLLRDRVDDARKLNDELLKARPDDGEARVYKGEIELRGGKANDAVNTLQAVVKSDPDNAVAHYQLGLAFNQAGNATRAEPEWRDAVRLNPDFTEAHRALAAVATARGDASGLAQEAEQIIRIQPGAEDGYRLRGMANVIRKQYKAADSDLHQALEKQANNPPAYVWLGNLRAAQNQMGEAQKFYQQALDQDPNSTDALGGVLNVYQAQKQTDRALATAKAQLAKYPKNAGFHVMVGALLVQAKDFAGAEAEFKQASDLDKNNVEARLKLGMTQSQRGNPDQALQTYFEGQKINPRQGAYYLMAGDIYNEKNDWDHAKQQYQKVLEVQPENTQEYAIASNDLAYVILEQGGNADLAFQMAQRARQKLPDLPNTADTLGWAFYHKQIYSSAITLCKEAVKKAPDNAMYNYHLGLAYAKNGQAALARQQRDRVRKIDPKFPNLDKLEQALSGMKG